MFTLLLFGSLGAAYVGRYYLDFIDSKKKNKHIRAGYKAWNTRKQNGRFIKINSPLAGTSELVWLSNK